MATRFLLDAPSLVYRAFFALPKTMTDPRGQSINAVRGFMDMTTTLIVQRRPDSVTCVFDADWRPRFRVDVYPAYKAERAEDPPELPPQFDIIGEVLDAAGVVRAEAAGLEADDVIGAMAQAVPDPERAVVVTGDRDLLCLVRDPQVRLLFPVKGTKEMKEFDEAAVEAAYGIPPRLYPEFAMLRGDSSDGLPGVPGVGPKTAVTLLKTFGSIDGIYSHLDDLSPKQRDLFEASRDYLDKMRTVVGLRYDAAIEATEPHPPDEDELKELGERYNLGSSIGRLLQALKGER
ncbi:MAG TPA: 5'-3' exonuclease H3TH domain-containing protein [Actinomycetota bacterium]|nr:5'-3' exonuclease H3TH domain-containing protein [Actinomycetota bacterium]